MLRILAVGTAIILASPANSAPASIEDRQLLEQLAKRMDHAWNDADVDANAALFTVDATARFGGDPLGEGREAIRNQFVTFFKDRPPGLRHVTTIERVEQLGPGLAMWDAEVRVERRRPTGEWEPLTRIRNVTVAERHPEGWQVRAVRAVPVAK